MPTCKIFALIFTDLSSVISLSFLELAGADGIEPPMTGSKPVALPLGDAPLCSFDNTVYVRRIDNETGKPASRLDDIMKLGLRDSPFIARAHLPIGRLNF